MNHCLRYTDSTTVMGKFMFMIIFISHLHTLRQLYYVTACFPGHLFLSLLVFTIAIQRTSCDCHCLLETSTAAAFTDIRTEVVNGGEEARNSCARSEQDERY